MIRAALGVLALIFALTHLPYLASTLEDIDSVNFALGVRDFDVASHRPHPPGYPVYIALGKVGVADRTDIRWPDSSRFGDRSAHAVVAVARSAPIGVGRSSVSRPELLDRCRSC